MTIDDTVIIPELLYPGGTDSILLRDSLEYGIELPLLIKSNKLDYDITIMIKDVKIPRQRPEFYYGNREYKRHLIDDITYPASVSLDVVTTKYINKKATQMLFRLNEGNGKALYLVGVEDKGWVNGLDKPDITTSINNLIKMSKVLNNCKISKITIYYLGDGKYAFSARIILITKLEIDYCVL